ncbi:hypothetical protein GCM10022279_03410 [Comamonas faecalis]|jgi:hypothetical protein|uniref:DUF1328 domain-containing protein n=1 Tax=Comamonas faecalis TaxID=1387849 RepID=A0ABP7QIV1_9BURK
MVIVRTLVMLLLVVAAVFFALFAATGRQHYKRWGLVILKWTLIAAAVFFGVLIAQRIG